MAINYSQRTRLFTGVTYLSKSSFDLVYTTFSSRIRGIAFILHDKDVDDSGKPETPHVHFIVHTKSSHSSATVLKWFKRFQFADENGVISILLQNCSDSSSAVDYLTHFCDPHKHQYEYKEIVRIGDCSFLKRSHLANDYTADIIDRMCMNGESLRLLAYEYGRDFVYHYTQFRSLAEDIRLQETNKTLLNKVVQEIDDFGTVTEEDLPF